MAVTVANRNLEVDWQLSKECVRDRIETLLKTSQWSDCTFQVGERTDFEVKLLEYKIYLFNRLNIWFIFWRLEGIELSIQTGIP
jgi:hypothetical protein